ncbi:MAG: hypothetical protein AAF661_15100 [Pseudomonadota bacterium]
MSWWLNGRQVSEAEYRRKQRAVFAGRETWKAGSGSSDGETITQYVKATERQLTQRMNLATQVVRGRVVELLSVGQDVRRSSSGRLIGLSPSRPGEPPRVLSGRLRQSITARVARTPSSKGGAFDETGTNLPGQEVNNIVGVVGTNVRYARRLERGFTGTDSRGRLVRQAPRPFLFRALQEKLTDIRRILTGTLG